MNVTDAERVLGDTVDDFLTHFGLSWGPKTEVYRSDLIDFARYLISKGVTLGEVPE